MFALGSLPSSPLNLRKNDNLSSGTNIHVEWSLLTDDTLAVLGYKLYANTGRNEPLRLVYESNSQVSSFSYDSIANSGESIDNKLAYRF